MKRKIVAIFLSIALVLSLLIPSTVVKAEPSDGQDETFDEQIDINEGESMDSENIQGEEGTEQQILEEDETGEQKDVSVEESQDILDPGSYDPVLFKLVLYTLGKTKEDSITISDLDTITKIDVDELQKNYDDLANIKISSFSLLGEVKNLQELNLGNVGWSSLKELNLSNDSWDGIEALSKLPNLNKLKINGCTFIAVPPATTISQELLSKLTIEKDTSSDSAEHDKTLVIKLDDINLSADNNSFTIPNIEEIKPVEELADIDKANVLSSEIIASEGEWSISNYNVSFTNETFTSKQIPMEIKLSSNRVKAIIKFNILVDSSLIKGENVEETPGNSEDNTDNPSSIIDDNKTTENTEVPEEPGNTKPVINANDKTIKVGDEFNPLEGVTATDEEDGDITSKVEVLDNKVDINTAGEYEVTYSVKDSSDLEATLTIKVTVEAKEEIVDPPVTEAPVIEASDKVIKVGDKFDPLEGVTAKDKNGGDITKSIEVKENGVNTNEAGKYNVTYYVKDGDGVEATKTIFVTVQKGEETVNTAPIINAENKIIEIGSKFNELEGVSATDEEDGDITDRIIVISSNVDINKEGVYVITYEVKDKDGTSTRKTIEVTVMKPIEEENKEPVINASDRTIKVGDKFNPLDGVTAFDKEDGELTSKLKVTENMVDINSVGKYTVTFEVSDSGGKKVSKSINVTVDKAAIAVNKAPVITAYNKVITTGSKFNPHLGVTASDAEDGNITNKVTIIYNNLNTNVVGLYRIVYEVSDNAGYKVTKSIYVNVVSKSNTRPIIYVDEAIVPLGSKYNPYAMVSAYDKEDGNITGKVIVVYNYVNVNKEGVYKVGYKVTDSMGVSASCVVKVTVKNYNNITNASKNESPILYANDISVSLGSKFNPLEWVVATDKDDGDITNRVMVISNDVNTSIVGNYHVTYEVIDSTGNKVNKAILVYVKEEKTVEEENKPPVINADDISLEKGMYFDPLDGVTALDEEDGNLTYKIIVKENEVNVSKAGVYKVTYEVADSMDEKATKSINVTIEGGSALNSSFTLVAVIGGVLLIIVIGGVIVAVVLSKKKR